MIDRTMESMDDGAYYRCAEILAAGGAVWTTIGADGQEKAWRVFRHL